MVILPVPNYADFDLGETKNVSGWKLRMPDRKAILCDPYLFPPGKEQFVGRMENIRRLDDNRKNEVIGLFYKTGISPLYPFVDRPAVAGYR